MSIDIKKHKQSRKYHTNTQIIALLSLFLKHSNVSIGLLIFNLSFFYALKVTTSIPTLNIHNVIFCFNSWECRHQTTRVIFK